MPAADLTDRDRRMLDLEREWFRFGGRKDQAIRDTFDLSPTRYYQALNALIDNPAAMVAEPVLVKRLRRLREARRRQRHVGRRLAS